MSANEGGCVGDRGREKMPAVSGGAQHPRLQIEDRVGDAVTVGDEFAHDGERRRSRIDELADDIVRMEVQVRVMLPGDRLHAVIFRKAIQMDSANSAIASGEDHALHQIVADAVTLPLALDAERGFRFARERFAVGTQLRHRAQHAVDEVSVHDGVGRQRAGCILIDEIGIDRRAEAVAPALGIEAQQVLAQRGALAEPKLADRPGRVVRRRSGMAAGIREQGPVSVRITHGPQIGVLCAKRPLFGPNLHIAAMQHRHGKGQVRGLSALARRLAASGFRALRARDRLTTS